MHIIKQHIEISVKIQYIDVFKPNENFIDLIDSNNRLKSKRCYYMISSRPT